MEHLNVQILYPRFIQRLHEQFEAVNPGSFVVYFKPAV